MFGNFHFHEERNHVCSIERGREKRGDNLRGQEAGQARQGAVSAGPAGVSTGGSGVLAAASGRGVGVLAADGVAGKRQDHEVDCNPGSGPTGRMDLAGTAACGDGQISDHA